MPMSARRRDDVDGCASVISQASLLAAVPAGRASLHKRMSASTITR